MMKVKICGITDEKTALYAAQMGADAIGFVFAPSKRRIEVTSAKRIIQRLPANVEKVGVFVNETASTMSNIANECGLTMIQLHGEEPEDIYKDVAFPIIKAVGIDNEKDVSRAERLSLEYVLVDSPKGSKYHGGNGTSFDWHIVKGRFQDKKLILAGGLHSSNVQEAIRIICPFMVDVSSGVETNGVKDFDKIRSFIQAAKGAKK